MNEAVVLVSVWLMFHYTEFVGDPELRYDLAFYFLYIVSIDVALNVLLLLYIIVKKIYSAIRLAIIKRKMKKS